MGYVTAKLKHNSGNLRKLGRVITKITKVLIILV